MTLPNERYRAVFQTREFLLELLDPHKTPRIPKNIRQRACVLLRHYPLESEVNIVADRIPDFFDKSDEK